MNLNKINGQKYVFEQNKYNSSSILELPVKFASQICHENTHTPLDGAYLSDFGIDITTVFRPSCPSELHTSKKIHWTPRWHLGSFGITNAITHSRHSICRSYSHHLGNAFRTGTLAIYGSRGKCQLPKVSSNQGM